MADTRERPSLPKPNAAASRGRTRLSCPSRFAQTHRRSPRRHGHSHKSAKEGGMAVSAVEAQSGNPSLTSCPPAVRHKTPLRTQRGPTHKRSQPPFRTPTHPTASIYGLMAISPYVGSERLPHHSVFGIPYSRGERRLFLEEGAFNFSFYVSPPAFYSVTKNGRLRLSWSARQIGPFFRVEQSSPPCLR